MILSEYLLRADSPTPCARWTQNNSVLELRHSKRGRLDEEGKGEQDSKGSVWVCVVTENISFPFNFGSRWRFYAPA
jgi:hypothetical protein